MGLSNYKYTWGRITQCISTSRELPGSTAASLEKPGITGITWCDSGCQAEHMTTTYCPCVLPSWIKQMAKDYLRGPWLADQGRLFLALICCLGGHSWTNISGSGTHFKREMVLQKVTEVARETEPISCEVKLRELSLFSLVRKRQQGDGTVYDYTK